MVGDRCYGMKLSPLAVGLSLGMLNGIILMLFTIGEIYGLHIINIEQWGNLYPGVAPTWLGCLMGLAWGFLGGLVFGAILAEVYNVCLSGSHCCCCQAAHQSVDKPIQ